MQYGMNRAWLEVDLDAIAWNYQELKRRLPAGCEVMAVLKANAYGLGAVAIARELEDNGCPSFAVVCLEEAVELRKHGISGRILVMGPVDEDGAVIAADNDIEVALVSLSHARRLSSALKEAGRRLKGHIKIDSGLHRLGIVVKDRMDQAESSILEISTLEAIHPVALFTHFAASEFVGGEEFNRSQIALFEEIVERLEARSLRLEKHCLSSIPTVKYTRYCYDYVRVAALLFGFRPDTYHGFDIRPCVQLRTRIAQTKTVPAGSAISYGPLFHTLRKTRLAVVTVGFADGLRRSIANGGCMLVHGKKAPIIGKLSSDYSILDVTDIPEAEEGDVVTVFGRDGDIEQPVSHYADLYPGTVAEVTAAMGTRIPRYYIKGGQVTSRT